MKLHRHAFQNIDRGLGGHAPGELQARSSEEGPKFGFRALSTPRRPHQHLYIEQLARGRLITRQNDCLHYEHPAAWDYRLSAVREDLLRALIIPIVKNVLEDVRLTLPGYASKEIAVDDLAAPAEAFLSEEHSGSFSHLGAVK